MLDFAEQHWQILALGALNALMITAACIPLFIVLGICLALARRSRIRLISGAAAAFVELIRGTPLLLQLYFLYYALPLVGPSLDPLTTGMLALTLNSGAYFSEVVRAGFQSVARGQRDAAIVLGMGRWLTFRRVLMPQALVLVLPTLGNNIIELFKATSLLSIITVNEIVFYAGRVLAQTLQTMNVWILVGIFYFVVAWPASVGIGRLEIALTRWSRHGNQSQSHS